MAIAGCCRSQVGGSTFFDQPQARQMAYSDRNGLCACDLCTAYWSLHLAFDGIDGKLDGHDGPKSTTPVIPSIRMPTVERERSADSHISE